MADYFRLPLIEMEPGHTLEPTHCGYYKTVRDMWKNGRYKGILIYDYGYDEQEEKKAEEVYKKSLESPGRSSFGVGSVLVALFFYLLFLLEPLYVHFLKGAFCGAAKILLLHQISERARSVEIEKFPEDLVQAIEFLGLVLKLF